MMRRRPLLIEWLLLAFFGVFLLYPLGYVFPGALSDQDYEVRLLSLGEQPAQWAQVLAVLKKAQPAWEGTLTLKLPYTVQTFPAASKGRADQLVKDLQAAGAQAEVVTRVHPTLFYFNQALGFTVQRINHFPYFHLEANSPALWECLRNSLFLALTTATTIMLLTAVISWIVVRTKLPGRWLLYNLASLPLVFPGLVLGLSIMICYLTIDIGIYGTIWILLIAYVTRFLPYGMRYNSASMLQIHKELEESAAMSGASWGMTFRRVVLPLLKPGLLAGWIYVLIVSIRELSSSILLYSPGSEVVSVMIWELWQNGQAVELSALGVMLIVLLFALVMLAQLAGKRFGITEA